MVRAYCKQKQKQMFKIFIFIYLGASAFLRLKAYCKFSN